MLSDIYVLAKNRYLNYAQHFLNIWAKEFDEAADEYEFPQYSDEPEIVYQNPIDLIEKLVQEPQQPHAIYWNNPKNDMISSAMLFFTIDSGMIVGISVKSTDLEKLGNYLKELVNDVDGQLGCILFEEPPPISIDEFKQIVNLSSNPKYP